MSDNADAPDSSSNSSRNPYYDLAGGEARLNLISGVKEAVAASRTARARLPPNSISPAERTIEQLLPFLSEGVAVHVRLVGYLPTDWGAWRGGNRDTEEIRVTPYAFASATQIDVVVSALKALEVLCYQLPELGLQDESGDGDSSRRNVVLGALECLKRIDELTNSANPGRDGEPRVRNS